MCSDWCHLEVSCVRLKGKKVLSDVGISIMNFYKLGLLVLAQTRSGLSDASATMAENMAVIIAPSTSPVHFLRRLAKISRDFGDVPHMPSTSDRR
jgi:hypothetical protein